MLEQLVGSSTDAFPKILISGPGPQELIAYEKGIGYFGEVSSSEVITVSQLSQYLEFGNGVEINVNTNWLKFYRGRRVLFVTQQPVKRNVSWNELQLVGAVNGEAAIEIDGLWFKIRLLDGVDPGYVGEEALDYDSVMTHGSEWNDLMYSVVANNASYPKTSQVIENVRNFTYVQLGIGTHSLTRNKGIDSTDTVYTRGAPGVTSISRINTSDMASNIGWRICLELELDSLLPPWFYSIGGNAFIDTLSIEQLYQAPKDLDCEFSYIPPQFDINQYA